MTTPCAAARPRQAEIPRASLRSEPGPALARPPRTRQTLRKGSLNFLYAGMSPISCGEDAQGNIFVGTQGGNAYILQSASASDLIFKNGFEN